MNVDQTCMYTSLVIGQSYRSNYKCCPCRDMSCDYYCHVCNSFIHPSHIRHSQNDEVLCIICNRPGFVEKVCICPRRSKGMKLLFNHSDNKLVIGNPGMTTLGVLLWIPLLRC